MYGHLLFYVWCNVVIILSFEVNLQINLQICPKKDSNNMKKAIHDKQHDFFHLDDALVFIAVTYLTLRSIIWTRNYIVWPSNDNTKIQWKRRIIFEYLILNLHNISNYMVGTWAIFLCQFRILIRLSTFSIIKMTVHSTSPSFAF